jgi:hypothetical protein
VVDPGPELLTAFLDGGSVAYAVREQLSQPPSGLGIPFTNYGRYGVVRIDGASGTIQELPVPAPQDSTLRIAANSAGLVYVDDQGAIRLLRVGADRPDSWSIDTPHVPGTWIGATSAAISPLLAATETTVYWGGGSSVFRAALGSTAQPDAFTVDPNVRSIIAAGDRAYVFTGTYSGLLKELPASGPIADLGALPGSGPIGFEDGALYYPRPAPDAMAEGGGVVRVHPASLGAQELMLRYKPTVTVSHGWLYWLDSGYLLTRRAVPEASPDPVVLGDGGTPKDGPTWVRHEDKASFARVATRPGGGFALASWRISADASTPFYSGATFDEFFVSLYANQDTLLKRVSVPLANVSSPIGVDASGDVFAATIDAQQLGFLRLDASGNQVGAGTFALSQPSAFAVGSSGMLAATGFQSTDGAPCVPCTAVLKAFTKDGTPMWTADLSRIQVGDGTYGVPVVQSIAVTNDDRVLVGAGNGGFASDPTTPIGFVASFNDAGVLEWAKSLVGLGIAQLAARTDGDVVIAGFARFYFDLGDGPQLVPVPGRINAVLARLDPQGNVRWVRSFEGTSALQLAIDGNGAPVLAATLQLDGFADLGAPGVNGARTDTSFLARFDPSGSLSSIRRWNDLVPPAPVPPTDAGPVPSAPSTPAWLTSVAVDGTGTALLTSAHGSVAGFAP